MSKDLLVYKGYQGSCEFDLDQKLLRGKVLHIRSLITYSGSTIEELEASFQEELDEYLSDCEELGVEPNKPYSGVFQVRIKESAHYELVKLANLRGVNLNSLVNECIDDFLVMQSVKGIREYFGYGGMSLYLQQPEFSKARKTSSTELSLIFREAAIEKLAKFSTVDVNEQPLLSSEIFFDESQLVTDSHQGTQYEQ